MVVDHAEPRGQAAAFTSVPRCLLCRRNKVGTNLFIKDEIFFLCMA